MSETFPRIDAEWTWRGMRAILLENRTLRVIVLPELGGRIWSIVSKAHDREMLWHNERVPPRPAPYGATYDNWFAGGWDEVFPNDAPVTIAGEAYPDHGEIWSLPAAWSIAQTDDTVSLTLEHRGVALPTRFRKTITLDAESSTLTLDYTIVNEGRTPLPLDVHWKLHPALPVAPGMRLHIPARTAIVDEDFPGSLMAGTHAWPHIPATDGTIRDLRNGPLPDPDSGEAFFLYGTDLRDGRCAVSYPDEGVGFGLTFDHTVLNAVWIFATFDGWRGLKTLILEPCTGHFASLNRAIAAGSAYRLEQDIHLTTRVTAHILSSAAEVDAFTADIDIPEGSTA
ncbi:MAG: DUF5107 domain-containing protein [Thermomicrobiales bacterium]